MSIDNVVGGKGSIQTYGNLHTCLQYQINIWIDVLTKSMSSVKKSTTVYNWKEFFERLLIDFQHFQNSF